MPDGYRPEDYTPGQINAGQRKVNYALTEADEKIVDILKIVKIAILAPHGQMHTYIAQIDAAIEAATKAIDHVAEIIPPGCDPGPG